MFNPSHLELVNPVIEGYARYHQDKNNESDRQKILPVLIHGDAAFSGQGIVMETLNMSQSRATERWALFTLLLIIRLVLQPQNKRMPGQRITVLTL